MSWGVLSKKIPTLLDLKNQFYLLKWSHNHSLNHDALHLENIGEKKFVMVYPLVLSPFEPTYCSPHALQENK